MVLLNGDGVENDKFDIDTKDLYDGKISYDQFES